MSSNTRKNTARNILEDNTLRTIHSNDTLHRPMHASDVVSPVSIKMNEILDMTQHTSNRLRQVNNTSMNRIHRLVNDTVLPIDVSKVNNSYVNDDIRSMYQAIDNDYNDLLSKRMQMSRVEQPQEAFGRNEQAQAGEGKEKSIVKSPHVGFSRSEVFKPAIPRPINQYTHTSRVQPAQQPLNLVRYNKLEEKLVELDMKAQEQEENNNKLKGKIKETEEMLRKSENYGQDRYANLATLRRQANKNDEGFRRALVQNAMRNPDLNDFERGLVFSEAQDFDSLKQVMNVPVGTDLYRFKVEQFKETSTARGETQKLMYEQMLKNMKKGFDIDSRDAERRTENLLWDDEQRKNLLAGYIRRQLGAGLNIEYNGPPEEEEESSSEEQVIIKRQPKKKKTYDPTDGFIVYWDYCLGLPQREQLTAFEFQIVCNGENIRDLEQSAGEGVNDPEGSDITCKSIFGLKNRIKGVPINPDMLMIWKVYQMKEVDGREEAVEIGWTQIDLWTLARNLKRGRWKCPLYKLPVDPHITKKGVQELTPIPGIWFYLRISYPYNDEFNRGSLEPLDSKGLAEIPEIHLRAAQYSLLPPDIEPVIEKVPDNPTGLKTQLDGPDPDRPKTPPPPKEPDWVPPEEKLKDGGEGEEIQIGDRVGITVDVLKILNHNAQSHMRVMVTCYESENLVKDDLCKKWERLTMIHNPLVSNDEDDQLGIAIVQSQLAKEGKMANLAKGNNIIFKGQTFNLLRNLRTMIKNSRKTLYLLFQLLEKPAPKDVLAGKNKGFASDANANLGGLQYNCIGRAVYRLSTDDFNINQGKHTINFQSPSFNVPKSGDVIERDLDEYVKPQIEFNVTLRPYTIDDVEAEFQQFQEKFESSKKAKEDMKKAEEAAKKIRDQVAKQVPKMINNAPFIKNEKVQIPDKIFERGYGIDFYLDACRFLPDNVSVTKCIVTILNSNVKTVYKESDSKNRIKIVLPKRMTGDNDAYNPVFDYRCEYRKEVFDSTSLLFLKFVTIDTSNNSTRVIGYSGINLFVKATDINTQPETDDDPMVKLNSGCFELPIRAEEPYRKAPFNIERIKRLEILPCASCLIRIRQAPLSDDLKRVLGAKDVPRDQHKTMGIWPDRPEYSSGVYNNSQIKDLGRLTSLYNLRQKREPISLQQRVNELKRVFNAENMNMDPKETFFWIDSKINPNSSTIMLDGRFFSKYIQSSGFKFSIDAVHNTPTAHPYVCIYTINPPGLYYENGDAQDLHFVGSMDYNSPVGQQRYLDDYKLFNDISYDAFKHIIVEVKELVYNDEEFDVKDFGWCVIPIFVGDRYVTSGHYQMPLFKGKYPSDLLLDKLRSTDCLNHVQKMHKDGKIKWTDSYSSLMFRILDVQRGDQLSKPLVIKTLDFLYLPANTSDKTEFAYNQQVEAELNTRKKLVKTLPDRKKPDEFSDMIRLTCINKFNLKQYDEITD